MNNEPRSKISTEEWLLTKTADGAFGVRNKNGLICTLPKVQRYEGQDKRRIKELLKSANIARMIAKVGNLCQKYGSLDELERRYKQWESLDRNIEFNDALLTLIQKNKELRKFLIHFLSLQDLIKIENPTPEHEGEAQALNTLIEQGINTLKLTK